MKIKSIKVEDVEKFNDLNYKKQDEERYLKDIDNLLKNPDDIKVLEISFAANSDDFKNHGMGFATCMRITNEHERIKVLEFAKQLAEGQLNSINKDIEALLIECEEYPY